MALYDLKEFALKCGVKKAYVQQYLKRDKLVQRPDGLFDDQDEKNSLFMATRKGTGQAEIAFESPKEEEAEPTKPATTSQVKSVDPTLVQYEKQKKELEIQKLNQDIRIRKIQELKLSREIVPTDMIKVLFTRHMTSIINAYHDGANNLLTEITKKKGLTAEEQAELRFALVDIINDSTKKAMEESLKQVEIIQEEYSNKLERGQRK